VKAWWGWVVGGNVPDGGVVLVDRLTYHSHYAALVQTQAIADFDIRVMPSLPDGTVDLAALVVGDDVSVVCATMVGTHCGNVNPIAEIGAAATGVPVFVDGCQALGQLEIDVRALGCHVFTGTGRKFSAWPTWQRRAVGRGRAGRPLPATGHRCHEHRLDLRSGPVDQTGNRPVRGVRGELRIDGRTWPRRRAKRAIGMAAVEARVTGPRRHAARRARS
jgi:hypothetical protein